MATSIYAAVAVLIATTLGGYGALYLKLGANKAKLNFWKLIKNYELIMGVICYGLSTLIFIPALKYGDLSILYPLASVTYIWVLLLSKKYLNEKLNHYKILGIAAILIGVIFLGLGS